MKDPQTLRLATTQQSPPPFASKLLPRTPEQSPPYSSDAKVFQGESTFKRRALIVDDVADVTEMLSVLLSHAGYETVTASSASAALEAARQRQFDVIISDIGMPDERLPTRARPQSYARLRNRPDG